MVLFFLIFIIPIYNKGKQYGKKLYNQSNGIKKWYINNWPRWVQIISVIFLLVCKNCTYYLNLQIDNSEINFFS